MPLFVCDVCECVENTALGHYWSRNRNTFGPELQGKALCSECTPDRFYDGTPNKEGGKWHGKFPKRKIDKEELAKGGYMDRNGNLTPRK